MIQTIYQRSMRTDDAFQNSGMELLIEREIKTYGYYSKGQEGSGPLCLRSWITCSTWSTVIEDRECWWDQRLLIVSLSVPLAQCFSSLLLYFIYSDGCKKVPVHGALIARCGTALYRGRKMLSYSLRPLTSTQSWNSVSSSSGFYSDPIQSWPFLVTRIWPSVIEFLLDSPCHVLSGK